MQIYERLARRAVDTALAESRVVLISGPRQAGKTTLAEQVASGDMPFVTLDDRSILNNVLSDTLGFLQKFDRAVIDEFQMAPELTRAIKMKVDRNQTPGQFLLTGSSDLMVVPRLSDSLVGRMETVHLLPLSQAEIRGGQGTFLDMIFDDEVPDPKDLVMGRDLIETVLAGGYPGALRHQDEMRRWRWYNDYTEEIVQRDVKSIHQIEKLSEMPKLLEVLAHHSGQIANCTKIGAALGMNHVTTRKYTSIYVRHFLIKALQPWRTNKIKGLTKSPKIHFLDSGLLASLRRQTADMLEENRTWLGPIIESFVFSEMQKMAGWSKGWYEMTFMRTGKGREVDFVIENHQGKVVGIEVKASSTVSSSDFAGLRMLRDSCGDRFVRGYILFDHYVRGDFGDRMTMLPISSLWI